MKLFKYTGIVKGAGLKFIFVSADSATDAIAKVEKTLQVEFLTVDDVTDSHIVLKK